jgi:hypothetical protein
LPQLVNRLSGINLFGWGKRKPVCGLEIAGDGAPLKNLVKDGLTKGFAITLPNNNFTDEYERHSQEDKVELVLGDIFKRETWNKLQERIRKESPTGYLDLVISRAQGPLDILPQRPELYEVLLSRLLPLLDPNHGVAIIQLPGSMMSNIEKLSQETNAGNKNWKLEWQKQSLSNELYVVAKITRGSNGESSGWKKYMPRLRSGYSSG